MVAAEVDIEDEVVVDDVLEVEVVVVKVEVVVVEVEVVVVRPESPL